MNDFDCIIIGAGIAGASMAAEISDHCSVLLLEAEDHPGYHATGRSAAFWTETYGGPLVQPLTTASHDFLLSPPADFSDTGFLTRRRAINIGRHEDKELADRLWEDFADSGVAMERWDEHRLRAVMPTLKMEWTQAIYEPDCCDIDVARLHMDYLKQAKRNKTVLRCRALVDGIERRAEQWNVHAGKETYRGNILVNAAGAWADTVAAMANVRPLKIEPMQRTMVQLKTEPPSSPDSPLIVALDGSFYFKPESGGSYWLSPHDEKPVAAGDVAPDEMDVALAIDRFQSAIDVHIVSVTRKWAGLRSFTPDRLPVYGFDPVQPGFFWFAGQGGFGIQTAPAAARLAKALLLGIERDSSVCGIEADRYSPARFG